MAKKEIIQAEAEIPEIYTNSVKTNISIYEIMLQLGLESEGKIKPICNVRMSPQYPKRASSTPKMLSEVLARSVSEYEKKIGQIPMPKKR